MWSDSAMNINIVLQKQQKLPVTNMSTEEKSQKFQ